MPSATINVKYVNQPQVGKKMGTVKTDTGEYYSVQPAMLGQFLPNGAYTVEYTERMWQGKPYRTVQSITAAAAPTPSTSHGGGSYGGGRWSPEKEEQVFVTALLKSFIEAGKIEPSGEQLTKAIAIMRSVYAGTFGTKTAQAPKTQASAPPDFNDEIPF